MTQRLLIFGASARAAAFSALRAGYAPIVADMFADADLRARCRASRVADYPRGLAEIARRWPSMPWLYTGALENEPSLVDKISRDRPLWGNPAPVLRKLRDPWQIADAFQKAGLCVPRLAAQVNNVTADAKWLSKPLASCGGGRIHAIDPGYLTTSGSRSHQTLDDPARKNMDGPDRYFQQHIAGDPCGAAYVAVAGSARLLGVTRQLVGRDWSAPERFQYAGSWGPVEIGESCADQFRRMGDCLAARFGLTGLFGVDVILADDMVWPIEVNPRYTASIEVLERALSLRAIGLHAAACVDGRLPGFRATPGATPTRCGKAILYADADVVVGDDLTRELLEQNDGPWPSYADIPSPGTRIEAGQPVLTVFAEASCETELTQKLRDQLAAVRERLHA